MCFIDSASLSSLAEGVSRRRFLGAGLVAGLTAAAMDWGTSLVLPGVAEGAETPGASGGPGSAGVSFKWFGTDGWEITFGNKTILFDPWFSRFDSGFFTGKFNPNATLPLDEALIGQHVKKADHILIGHGHWDHMADVPYIAKKTNAMVIGSEIHDSTPRLLRALNYPKIVLPTHWDNFEAPFSQPPRDLRDTFGDPANLDLWVKEVKQLSPKSQIVTMKYFESFAP